MSFDFDTERFRNLYGVLEHRISQTNPPQGYADDVSVSVAFRVKHHLSHEKTRVWWCATPEGIEFMKTWTQEERLDEFRRHHPRRLKREMSMAFPEEWVMTFL